MSHTIVRDLSGEVFCTKCLKRWEKSEEPPPCEPRTLTVDYAGVRVLPKEASEHISLIGLMAAKLACYEPESVTVKRAMEYLERNRK